MVLRKNNPGYFASWGWFMVRKRDNFIKLICVILFPAACLVIHTLLDCISPSSEETFADSYVIGYEQGARYGSWSSLDATDDLIFVVYTENGSCIDAYDNSGTFRFTLFFRDKSNGATTIRCDQNLLYVRAEGGTVYVFEEDRELACLSSEEAKNRGFSSTWFSHKDSKLETSGALIRRLDGEGNTIAAIPLPRKMTYGYVTGWMSKLIWLAIPVILIVRWLRENKRGIQNPGMEQTQNSR